MKKHQKARLVREVWEAQGRACYICDKAMDLPTATATRGMMDATKDHVHPRAAHGSAGWGNILLAHLRCNQKKGDRMPTARELGRIHTTLAAMNVETLRVILESSLNTLEAARRRQTEAEAEVQQATAAASVVMRYAPTGDTVSNLSRLAKPATA